MATVAPTPGGGNSGANAAGATAGDRASRDPDGPERERADAAFADLRAENSRLREELELCCAAERERAERAEGLREIGRELAAELDLDRFLGAAWGHLTRLAGVDDCWVGLWDPAAEAMHYLLYVIGGVRLPAREAPIRLRSNQGLACELITGRTTINTTDYVAECRRRGLVPSGPLPPRPGNAWLGVPLVTGGRAVGAMAVWRFDRPFGDEVVRTLEALAGHMAAALENARLYHEAGLLAASDPLTGLANRRHVQDRLDQELEHAVRYQHQLAVVMLDLDNLKAVNDTYGHQVGDETLRVVAGALQAEARASDVLGRYGGDEFLLVLPESTAADARALLDRLHTRLTSSTAGRVRASPTVSAGIASFPADAGERHGLVAHADQALYANKRAAE